MATRIENLGEDGSGIFPYAEIDHTFQGKTYNVRLTALPPYRNPLTDELNCHVDFINVTDGVSGRFENQVVPAKVGPERRRDPFLRMFNQLIVQATPIASPVFP